MRSLLVALFSLSLSVAAEPLMRLRPYVVVAPKAEVRMDQLVDAQELSGETLAKLQSVLLVRAPEAGGKLELSQTGLMQSLRPIVQAERMRTGKKITLIVPKSVTLDTVRRGLQANVVEAELLQSWQPLCQDCLMEIEGLSLPLIDRVHDWRLKIKPSLPRGSFSVPVDLIRESGILTPAWINGRLLIKRKVPVAKRALQIGERVEASDFQWEYRDISYSFDGVPSVEEFAGKQIKQGLRVGEILWVGLLEKEKAIRRGDVVQVRSRSEGWEVTLSLIADRDAFIGDVINMKNPKTSSVIVGRVTGRGEVDLQ